MNTMNRTESPTRRRSQLIVAMLLAALGLLLSGVGLLLLSRQAANYIESARWPEYSLLDLVKSPTVKFCLPNSLVSWLYSPQCFKDLHGLLIGCLDVVSASWFFVIVGGFILWKSLR